MNPESVILGLIQGATEFLPVSSSGHLALAKIMAGYKDAPLAYDIVLHVATLLAVVAYFFKDIMSLLFEWCYGFVNANARRWAGWRLGWAVLAGTAVTAPFGFLLKKLVEERVSLSPMWLGINLLVTGALILSSRFLTPRSEHIRVKDGIFVGIMQGIAVLPGISRSGSTIWAGFIVGLSREDAFRFSFLLSIPAIVGALILETGELGASGFLRALPDGWFIGAAAAFASGFVSLVILKKLITSAKWWVFSIYCFTLGCVAIIYSLMGS